MNPQIQLMLQQAIEAFHGGNFNGADLTLRRVLQVDPKNLPALHVLGLIKASQENFKEAADLLGRAARIHPNDASIQYNLAKALSDCGLDKESIPHHKKAVQLAANNPEAWLNYGKSTSNLGRYADALVCYSKALDLKSDYAEAALNKGATLKELKRYEEAAICADQALLINPNLAEAWSNKAVALKELKRYDEAITHYDKALSLRPELSEPWSNKGVTLHELKRYDEAITHYDKALSLRADHAESWSNKGVTLHELKRYDEAITHYDKALSLRADHAESWSNKGVTLHELKRYDEAITHYDKALSLRVDHAESWSNKGVTLHELKRYDEAITHYDKALSLRADHAESWSNKGLTLHELKRYDEAITHYDKALSLRPELSEPWSNKGVTLHELKRYDEAITHYDKALSLRADHAESWSNKGVTLHELKRYDEAITHYDKALSLRVDHAESWSNKGVTLHELKRYDEAITHYDKALSLKTGINWVYGNLLYAKLQINSWLGLSDLSENITQKLMANEKVSQPFPLLALNDDALLHKKCSEIYAKDKYPMNLALGHISKRPKSEKIRIGYYSADFREHPVSILMVELFELHDKNRFEIYAFSFGVDDDSKIRYRLSKAFSKFLDVSKASDLEIAKLSREMQIDIAIDLGGHTASSRSGIFSYRAAPIQLSYLGYLGTMGAEYFDYLLADRNIIPDEMQKLYSEKITYLPSYQPNDRKRIISDRQFTRRELGLPETGFVFCCFNNNFKILPDTFDAWARILKAVKGGVLFLYAENMWSKENLKNEFEARGIEGTRLIFGEHMPNQEYLARYRCCNLFLDTFPYNAGTTASDALWAGVPIITLIGQSFASRVAASLLNAIGLPELITNSQEEYEALAIELAMNPDKFADLKQKLAINRMTTPLFDTPLFTKNLEAAYIKMYERYQADLQPDHIFFQN